MLPAPYDLVKFNSAMGAKQRKKEATRGLVSRRAKVSRRTTPQRTTSAEIPPSENPETSEDEESGEEEEEGYAKSVTVTQESEASDDESIAKPTPDSAKYIGKVRCHMTLEFTKQKNRKGEERMKADVKFTPEEIIAACQDPRFKSGTTREITLTVHAVSPIHASGIRDLLRPIYISAKKHNHEKPAFWNPVYSANKKKNYLAIIASDSTGSILAPVAMERGHEGTSFRGEALKMPGICIVATTKCKDITNGSLLEGLQLPVIADVGVDFLVEIEAK